MMGPAGKAWEVTCGRLKAPTHHPGLQSPPKPQGPRMQTFPAKQTSGAQSRGRRWSLSWLFCGSCPTELGPLGRAGSTVLSPKCLVTGPAREVLGPAPVSPRHGCGQGRGCLGALTKAQRSQPHPFFLGQSQNCIPSWGSGVTRRRITLALHRTPVCVWVEKTVDGLKPCGVLLQAEAARHVHHITWVFRAPVAQGDLPEQGV